MQNFGAHATTDHFELTGKRTSKMQGFDVAENFEILGIQSYAI